MKRKVFCNGCAYLFYTDKEGFIPLCLARARFLPGPLRPDVDVTGFTSAEQKNHFNNCLDRRKYSPRARRLKDWLLRSMDNGNNTEIEIEIYPRDKEKARWKIIGENFRAQKRRSEEKHYGREEETVGVDRGVDHNLGTETSDQKRGQLILDLQLDDGSGGESILKHVD